MMRKRTLPTTPDAESRQVIATFFNLEINEVGVEPQPDTFSINIAGNSEAQEQYKQINKFGNGDRPGRYTFTDTLMVGWNGKKIVPC